MKRLLTISTLLLVLTLGLGACGQAQTGGADKTFKVGIVQQVSHPALDGARADRGESGPTLTLVCLATHLAMDPQLLERLCRSLFSSTAGFRFGATRVIPSALRPLKSPHPFVMIRSFFWIGRGRTFALRAWNF